MSERIPVRVPGHEYEIHVGPGLLGRAGSILAGLRRGGRVFLVTNPVVARWHLAPLRESLIRAGFSLCEAVVPDGEEYKTLAQVEELYARAVEAELDRGDMVVALGGGVIGDLAGFVAATYLRGLAFVQVPTTLLAQVDSSVGGKVGVNLPAGKNLVGAFHQPCLVVSDVATLRTLPERELRAGMIELLKHDLLVPGEFSRYEANLGKLLAGDEAALTEGVARSCRLKAAVVAQDERELGGRIRLNLGHTVGHALEKAAGYGTWRHGEAVGLGLVVAGRLSCRLGRLAAGDLARLERAVTATLGRLPAVRPEQIDPMLRALGRDKKIHAGSLRFVLPVALGQTEVIENVTPEMVGRELAGLARPEAIS